MRRSTLRRAFYARKRDTLFTYSGLDLLLKRYVIQSRSREPLETPQEMFLGIALHLAMNEASGRMDWVRRFYDMLSRMEVTMATPHHVQRTKAPSPAFQLLYRHGAGQSGRHLPLR